MKNLGITRRECGAIAALLLLGALYVFLSVPKVPMRPYSVEFLEAMDHGRKDRRILEAEQWVVDDVRTARAERATVSFWFGGTLAVLGGAALLIGIFGRGKIARRDPLPATAAQN
ncbi:MAG TPA: hypothetical protein VHQ47_12480 [Phycisphaerae bacterium]|nr:hypothetical protein [Phycisphaerae bacterium]HWB96976.1 hypothetical protein [Bryobacteraceae bacterium]